MFSHLFPHLREMLEISVPQSTYEELWESHSIRKAEMIH